VVTEPEWMAYVQREYDPNTSSHHKKGKSYVHKLLATLRKQTLELEQGDQVRRAEMDYHREQDGEEWGTGAEAQVGFSVGDTQIENHDDVFWYHFQNPDEAPPSARAPPEPSPAGRPRCRWKTSSLPSCTMRK
jgi:hypothetical protein